MASNDQPNGSNTPRGLIGRRGTPAGKGARLPSIRAPRDLTLGGVPKKTFVPNLNARNRDKGKEDSPVTTPGPNVKNKRERDGRRDRGRGRGRPEVIQSHSIFEDGPAQVGGRSTSSLGDGVIYSGTGKKSDSSSNRTPREGGTKAAIKRELKREETSRILDSLLRDDFIVDEELENVDENLIPVKLPLSSSGMKCEVKHKISEVNAQHDGDSVDGNLTGVSDIDRPGVSAAEAVSAVQPKASDMTAAELFQNEIKSETGELLFFQLPDALPGCPPTPAEDNSQQGPSKKSEKSPKEEEFTKTMAKCSLAEFPEGHIGKIQILKSGRVRLVIGNHVVLNLTTGTPCGFLQDLVSVKTDQSKQLGQMAVLGQVSNKLVCSPDFEHLLGISE